MKCEDLQLNIPLYAEGELTAEENSVLDEHFAKCPVCRVKLSQFHDIAGDLRRMSVPQMPPDLLYSVRYSLAEELKSPQPQPWLHLTEDFREWMQYRLMPAGFGTIFSLFIVFLFLYSLNETKEKTDKVIEAARINTNRAIPTIGKDQQIYFTKEDYAALRETVSSESPSLNPNGPLLSLTKSLSVRTMKNGEVTFVADVFDSGLAKISEFVEAPKNQQTMEQLSKALEDDPAFVPADLDNRSDKMTVVFKIQVVNVTDDKPAKKKNPVK